MEMGGGEISTVAVLKNNPFFLGMFLPNKAGAGKAHLRKRHHPFRFLLH
jgi:hypothetical protein